jgi:hypothetical protein
MYIRVPARHALGQAAGPFEGTFTGTMSGDGGSSTTITATLTHRDTAVAGKITLGGGLQLDFPATSRYLPDVCKMEAVDLKEFDVKGSSDAANPRHAVVTAEADEPTTQGLTASMKIKITVTGDLSAGDTTLSTQVTLKPSVCGARTLAVTLKRNP